MYIDLEPKKVPRIGRYSDEVLVFFRQFKYTGESNIISSALVSYQRTAKCFPKNINRDDGWTDSESNYST